MNAHRFSILAVAIAGLLAVPGRSAWGAEKPKDPVIKRAAVEQFLAVEAIRRKNPLISLADWERATGVTLKEYPLSKIEAYLNDMTEEKQATDLDKDLAAHPYRGPRQFPWLALRRSYSDVLASEDPTQIIDPKRKFDDLQGALISFNRDFIKDVDTWSAEAALIAPFSWGTGHTLREGDFLNLARYGIIPSYGLNRISNNGDPSKEVDLRTYRLGVFAKFESGRAFPSELTFRGFGTYIQDEQHDADVMAGEFEIEPQADFADFSPKVKLGYAALLIPKPKAQRKDVHDTAILAYQLRALLRGEYGSVTNEGPTFTGAEFDYFRLGPVFQLDFKPFFFRRMQLSLRYQYLPTISGDDPRAALAKIDTLDTLFRTDLEWLIVDPKESPGQRISLKASYINGGLGPIQEKTETLLIGLGAAF